MTYRESYMQLNSIDEILAEAKRDIIVAAVINPDRVKVIKRAAEDAIKKLEQALSRGFLISLQTTSLMMVG